MWKTCKEKKKSHRVKDRYASIRIVLKCSVQSLNPRREKKNGEIQIKSVLSLIVLFWN